MSGINYEGETVVPRHLLQADLNTKGESVTLCMPVYGVGSRTKYVPVRKSHAVKSREGVEINLDAFLTSVLKSDFVKLQKVYEFIFKLILCFTPLMQFSIN